MFNDAISVKQVQARGLCMGSAQFELFQINRPEFCGGERPRLQGTPNELALHAHSCE